MTKRIKKNKKWTSSSIDEKYIDSLTELKKPVDLEKLSLKFSLLGKSSRGKLKLSQIKKEAISKNKNSPEVARIKKLKRKISLYNKMNLDSDTSNEQKELDIWEDSIDKKSKNKLNLKNINQIIPGVELPHPGQSYNPDPEDYKSLVNHSANIINLNNEEETTKGVQEIDEIINKHIPLIDTSTLDLKKKQLILRSINKNPDNMDQIDKILRGEEPSESEQKSNDEIMERRKAQKRKTRAERNKIKLLKEEKRKKMVIKSIKKMKNDVNHIKKLNNLKPRSKALERIIKFKRYIERLISGEVPTKISNKKFYSDPPKANLPEELSSSVKNIDNAKESPINEVFKSIYRRGLLPPPPKLNYRYKNLIRKLKSHNRTYIYKPVISN